MGVADEIWKYLTWMKCESTMLPCCVLWKNNYNCDILLPLLL